MDIAEAESKARLLAKEVLKGGNGAPKKFADLVGFLLGLTVVKNPSGGRVILDKSKRANQFVLSGWNTLGSPIPLANGEFLRLAMTLYTDEKDHQFLKVLKSNCQYQRDEAGDKWIFRYDFSREPGNKYAASHIQVRGQLTEAVQLRKQTLENVHFPTRRISIESILRLLIDDFNIKPNQDDGIWRAALAASEGEFYRVAHQ
jgi:hypothetical protein